MNFADSLAQETLGAICNLIGTFENLSGLFARLPQLYGEADFSLSFWEQLNRLTCDRPTPPGPYPTPLPQCDAIEYSLVFTYSCVNDAQCGVVNRSNVPITVWGPVEGFRVAPNPNAATNHELFITARHDSPTSPIEERARTTFTHFRISGCPPDPVFVSLDVTRPDGQTDACDEIFPIPPLPPPGWNIINNNNFTWNDIDNNQITENLSLTFGFAYISLSGELNVPVNVDVGGINFNGTFNFNKGLFEFELNPDFGSNPGNRNPDVREPSNPLNPPLPDEPTTPDEIDEIPQDDDVIEDDESDDPNNEASSKIVAARVIVTQVGGSVGELYQDSNPNIALPNYGYIQFFIPTSEIAGAWTSDIPVKNRNNFIPVDWPDGAIAVRGTPRIGIEWTIQALYAKQSTERRFPIGV